MIAYGVCIGPSGSYERILLPSLPPNAIVFERRKESSIFTAYNSILDEVAHLSKLEAIVLVHDDVELGSRFEDDVRNALKTGAGVVGAIGSLRPPSIAWWEGERRGRAMDATFGLLDAGGGTHEVDTVDGLVMVLSPECARSVRFDERSYHGFHAYDIDYCCEAKSAGFRVSVAPLDLIHRQRNTTDVKAWRRADLAWQRKWGRTAPQVMVIRRTKLACRLAGSWVKHACSRWSLAARRSVDRRRTPGHQGPR